VQGSKVERYNEERLKYKSETTSTHSTEPR